MAGKLKVSGIIKWCWTPVTIESSIDFLKEHKLICEWNTNDLNAYKIRFYEQVNFTCKLRIKLFISILVLHKIFLLHWSANSRANRGGSVVNCSIYKQLNTHTITKKNNKIKEGIGGHCFPYKKGIAPIFFSPFFSLPFFPYCPSLFRKSYYLPIKFSTALLIWKIST